MRRPLFLLTVGALACHAPPAHQPRRSVPQLAIPVVPRMIVAADRVDCITRPELERVWQPVLDIIDVAQQPAPSAPTLIEDGCTKQVFDYGEYRLIARRTEQRGLKVSTISSDATPACLASTIARAQELLPSAKVIIERGMTEFGNRWAEPDIGVMKWLDCEGPSFATFLHEINHALRENECLHDPSGTRICFDGLDELPPRKLARLDTLPVKRNEGASAFEQLQQVYFAKSNGEQSVMLLLDELLAYGITTEAEAALLGAGLPSDRVIMLPLMAYATMNYWERLRRDQPKDFERAMGRDTSNRGALSRLLTRSEASFAAWRAVRDKRNQAALDRGEDALWREYLAAKKRVLGSDDARPRGQARRRMANTLPEQPTP